MFPKTLFNAEPNRSVCASGESCINNVFKSKFVTFVPYQGDFICGWSEAGRSQIIHEEPYIRLPHCPAEHTL